MSSVNVNSYSYHSKGKIRLGGLFPKELLQKEKSRLSVDKTGFSMFQFNILLTSPGLTVIYINRVITAEQ